MSSRKKVGGAAIPKNTDISLIDLAHIACYNQPGTERSSSEAILKRSALQA
jgi:hypothetical protein